MKNMKTGFFIVFFLFIRSIYAQSFLWSFSVGGTANDEALGIATGINKEVYITGYFRGNVNFGFIMLVYGKEDIFTAKYDSTGKLLWVRSAGSAGNDHGYDIAVDKNGNAYVTGYFEGTIEFGSINMTSATPFDYFLVKYDANGALQWVMQGGGACCTGNHMSRSLTTDDNGNVYVLGYFDGTIGFGSTILSAQGSSDIFLAKYDGNGALIWGGL